MTHAFKAIRLTNSILSGSGAALLYGNTPVVLQSQTGAFVTTSQTGQFYAANNPSGFITAAQAGGVQSLVVTGTNYSGNLTITGLGGVVVTAVGSTISISGGSSINTGSFVTTSQTGSFVTTNQTGSFITASQTGQFVWTGSQQSFISYIPTGVDNTGIFYPSVFPSIPKVQTTVEVFGNIMYMVNIQARTTSGYTAIFSDTVQETGVYLHTYASL